MNDNITLLAPPEENLDLPLQPVHLDPLPGVQDAAGKTPPSRKRIPRQHKPTIKAPIGLSADDPASEAVRKFLRYHYDKMLAQEAGCLAGIEIEAIHDMRVATRRMRSVLGLFRFVYEKKAIRPYLRDLKTAAGSLGEVRDLDVMIEKLGQYVARHSTKTHEGMRVVMDALQLRRELSHQKLINYLNSKDYQHMKGTLLEFLETPYAGAAEQDIDIPGPNLVRHLAPIMLYTQLGHTQAYQEVLPSGKTETYHALRIEFKKLRYMMEFFSELLGPPAVPLIGRIKVIQEHLGDLNDAEVARKEMWKFLNSDFAGYTTAPLTATQITALGQYIVFREKEKARLISTFDVKWKSFNSHAFRRTLAACIGKL